MKNLTWQNPEQLFVAQELINKVKSKCCGIKDSNELHFIDKKRIHRAVEQLVESLELAAGSTTGFNLYAVVESYFTDLNKRREINRLLNLEQNICEEVEEELGVYEM